MKSNHYTKLMINWDWFFCDGSSEFSLLHRFHTDYKMTKTALKCVLPDCDYETDKMADEGKLVDTLDTCSGWQPQFRQCRTSAQLLLHAYCIAGGNAAVAESGTPLTTACDVHIAQLGTACMVPVLYDRSDAATARYCTAVTICQRQSHGMTAVSLCCMPLDNCPFQIFNYPWQDIFIYVAVTQS